MYMIPETIRMALPIPLTRKQIVLLKVFRAIRTISIQSIGLFLMGFHYGAFRRITNQRPYITVIEALKRLSAEGTK